ncbi:hypothetical protein EU805_15900 [Salipiger sp. IMCC34102]|uniref:Hpt domain-containing protein n=1 Tax=Salipiger sp. IMCC34102 TaxID=2510647 RepID=UPI00101C6DD4|nr:Hpt domain-containing protein [Salipiger sp. IMCC34102]RYH00937.1 hypothetical protein EU805_15900 [Salipiger sp. IMCC34102]
MTPGSKTAPALNMSGALDRLRARFLDAYPAQHAELERLFRLIRAGQGDRACLVEFTRILHRIGGTAGTIGLSALGKAAQEGEARLLRHLDALPPNGPVDPALADLLCGFMTISANHATGP